MLPYSGCGGTWLLFPFSKKANVGELEGSFPSVYACCTVRYISGIFAYRKGATIAAAVINQSGKCQWHKHPQTPSDSCQKVLTTPGRHRGRERFVPCPTSSIKSVLLFNFSISICWKFVNKEYLSQSFMEPNQFVRCAYYYASPASPEPEFHVASSLSPKRKTSTRPRVIRLERRLTTATLPSRFIFGACVVAFRVSTIILARPHSHVHTRTQPPPPPTHTFSLHTLQAISYD